LQLTRLKIFHDQCRQDLTAEGALAVEIFHKVAEEWRQWDRPEAVVIASGELDTCLNAERPYRKPNDKHTLFPLPEIRAVVKAAFHRAPQEVRREQLHRVVLKSLINATNAYEAEYNQLTGLLGKKALLKWLTNALADASPAGMAISDSVGSAARAIAVISIDIDFFKQVNDSYGHPYGDLVLKAFGMRLDNAVTNFIETRGGKISAIACHASGEEFFCLAAGHVDSAAFEDLAEAIRMSVATSPIPDDSQLPKLLAGLPFDSITIPPVHTRRLSCSVGLVISGAVPTDNAAHVGAVLLKQADMALYRAKTLGRDRTVLFSSILQRCGRVIEDRTEIGVLTIDIGLDVGVKKGQEFLVFHPDFSGATPFSIDDGRSKRVLGRYPRVSFCRISAFDVQAQIAFCRRTDKEAVQAVPAGALLEAIPLGSIGHLFSGTSEEIVGLADWLRPESESKKFFAQQVKSPSIEVLVLRIQNQDELLEKRGADFVNRSLAASVEVLREVCPQARFAGSIESTEIAIVSEQGFDTEALQKSLSGIARALGSLPRFSVGIFRPMQLDLNDKWGPDSYEARLQLARYTAAFPNASVECNVEIFSLDVARRVLRTSWESRDVSRGLADFDRLRQLGFVHASLWNYAGLIAIETGDLLKSSSYFSEAFRLDSSDRSIRRNYLTIQTWVGEYEKAQATATTQDYEELWANPLAHIAAAAAIVGIMIAAAERQTEASTVVAAEEWAKRVGPHAEPWQNKVWDEQTSRLTSLIDRDSGTS
jgi:diguanylate cyclase (GGDEF)-like protein